jgi:uncharacterized protein YegP (UPF0339 family)
MGLFDKILAKNKADKAYFNYDEPKDIEDVEPAKEKIEDFPLSPVVFDEDETIAAATIIRKPKENKKAPTEIKKEPPKKPSKLELSTKKLLRLQNELKSLTVLQVEKLDGDIIPDGIITGKFEIERTMDSKRWLFRLLTTTNNVIGESRTYSSVSSAMNGIHSVITNAGKASIEDQTLKKAEILSFPKWVIYLDNSEKFNFILYASNGNPVIHSHGYANKTNCKKGIEGVIIACKNPMIEKTYLHHKDAT